VSSTTELESDVMVEPVTTGEIIDEKKLAQQLLEQSREQSSSRRWPVSQGPASLASRSASLSAWASLIQRGGPP
jgi:hypothetical protein